uniref:Uncharacterized protein n=1 Tax=Arundo donax TaxID=35708 RepID=A0A0A9F273_ARUDO
MSWWVLTANSTRELRHHNPHRENNKLVTS